jgi:hypothetical protein
MNKVITYCCFLFLLNSCNIFPYQSTYKKDIKASEIIYKQKPIMYIARERKMFFVRLLIREHDVFTLTTDTDYGCGTYKKSNDTIYLNYFNTEKLKNRKGLVVINLRDSTATLKNDWSKKEENLKIIPPDNRYFFF